jgi:hypothetical protein
MFYNRTFLIIRILIVLNMHVRINKCRDSSVTMAMSYGLDSRGSIPGRGKKFFFMTQRPDRLWGPSSLLSNGYRGSYHRGKATEALSSPITSFYCRGQEWWSYTSTPQHIFLAWFLIKHRNKFTFTYIHIHDHRIIAGATALTESLFLSK